jgi:FAD/FMN-containing dehydrogenase
MISNNSCGVHSVLAQMEGYGSGRTADNVDEMEILTYDGCRMRIGKTGDDELEAKIRKGGREGEIYAKLQAFRDKYADLIRARYPDIPRRVSGYNLPQLLPEKHFHVARALAGTEGTCVTILEATVALVKNPPARALLVIGYPDIYQTGDHAAEVLEQRPVGLEALDGRLIDNMKRKGLHVELTKLLPEGGGWLAARRVRRREQGAGGRDRETRHGQARGEGRCAARQAVHEQGRAGGDLDDPRVRARRHRLCARHSGHLGRLGGFGGAAREGR